MKLTIVYDNEVYEKGIGLKSDWGFSCLIETKEENILFDCGAKGNILLNNMQKLKLDPKDINKIVISHEHWDHKGGLKLLLPVIKNVQLCTLGKEDDTEKITIKNIKESQIISKGVYSTGNLSGSPVDEQSLVLEGKTGWCVLAGCSHSGVGNILHISKKFGKVVGLIGGLHGFNDFNILNDLNVICPCHCTKYKKQIKKMYPAKYVEGGVGRVFDI